jgi:sugar/nucleoside kinase (ribokinase family)
MTDREAKLSEIIINYKDVIISHFIAGGYSDDDKRNQILKTIKEYEKELFDLLKAPDNDKINELIEAAKLALCALEDANVLTGEELSKRRDELKCAIIKMEAAK